MSDISIIEEIRYLVSLSLAGEISDQQLLRLNEIIASDCAARSFYLDLIAMNNALNSSNWTIEYDKIMLEDLADLEQNAPEVIIEQPKDNLVKIKDHSTTKHNNTKNKIFQIFDKIVYVAALLMVGFIIYGHIFKPAHIISVATVTDQLNTIWDSSSEALINNERIFTNQAPYKLNKGIVKLTYDEGVDIVIEGPAEFVVSSKGIKLEYGSLYSYVSSSGRGFTVDTPNNRFIDLGTEFGIIVDKHATSELHVLKGKVQYFSGLPGTAKASQVIRNNNARRFDSSSGDIQIIPVSESSFVRQINSNSGTIWYGQGSLSLPNLFAGNLFKSSTDGVEISPSSGTLVEHDNYVSGGERTGTLEYHISDASYIDGTFVPIGSKPQKITSTNITWQSSLTSGSYHYNLSDQKTIYDNGVKYSLALDLENDDKPLILLHPNIGITIDLNAIRKDLPSLNISNFQAKCGITSVVNQAIKNQSSNINNAPIMDFTILIDGDERLQYKGITPDSPVNKIDIEINPEDQFLTLVSTDGDQSIVYDWFILSDPVFKLVK